MSYNYFVYITTNPKRTTLYIGVTNDLRTRLQHHFDNCGNPKSFAGRYYCYNLVYFEQFYDIKQAIEREKELKGWKRERKKTLISAQNPKWKFLNNEV